MWQPANVKPDLALGAVVVVCVVLSGLFAILAGRQMKRQSGAWMVAAGCSLALGLAAVAAQCIEYTVQHFGPTNGGYASVFCAWTGFYMIAVLFTMYWLETQGATELRGRARRRRLLLGLPRRDRGRDVRDAVSPVVLATAVATPGFWDWAFDPPL